MARGRDNEELEYTGELITETELAWLFEIEGEEIWLPKSQCELSDDETSILIPRWLARAKGLD